MASTTARQTIAFAPDAAAGTSLPPGPKLPAPLQTLAWALAPTWLMDRCARRLGDAFTLTFAPSGLQLAMFSDPDAVKTIFTAPPDVAPSATGLSPVAPVLGASSVLVLTGPEHMRQRKLLLPPFHGERMREYEDAIVQATRRDMSAWSLGRAMRMQPHTRLITLEVILQAVFGVEAERMEPLKQAITDLFEPVRPLTVLRTLTRRPTGARPTGAVGRALARLDALIYAEIQRRRAQSNVEQRSDILSLLLLARDDDGQAMTDVELRDELVTLLLAGHETTATSVAWALERLVRHPDKLARLLAEIDARGDGGAGAGGVGAGGAGAGGVDAGGVDVGGVDVGGVGAGGADAGGADAGGADAGDAGAGRGDEYLTAVVNETLRVRPVVPLVVRGLTQELRVGSYLLPAGTRVVPSIYLTNRNPRVYDQPLEFRPERFLGDEGGPPRAINSFSWIPFGGGIRRCIGASFALLEMKVMLRTMLEQLEPHAPHARTRRRGELMRRRAITLVPDAGGRVVWERRAARPSRSAK
jgi:cytochrome P450